MMYTKKPSKTSKSSESVASPGSLKSKLSKIKLPIKLTTAYSKHTKLKIVLTVILLLLVGWLIYSNTSLSDKVIYDSSTDKSAPKFGKGILPEPKEEDKEACNFIDPGKLNQQHGISLELATARVVKPKPSGGQTVVCEYRQDAGRVTVVKSIYSTDAKAKEVYDERKTDNFKQINGVDSASYSKSQKQILLVKGKSFYSINIISKDTDYVKLEDVSIEVAKQIK